MTFYPTDPQLLQFEYIVPINSVGDVLAKDHNLVQFTRDGGTGTVYDFRDVGAFISLEVAAIDVLTVTNGNPSRGVAAPLAIRLQYSRKSTAATPDEAVYISGEVTGLRLLPTMRFRLSLKVDQRTIGDYVPFQFTG